MGKDDKSGKNVHEEVDAILSYLSKHDRDLVVEHLIARPRLSINFDITPVELCALCEYLPLYNDGKYLFPRNPIDREEERKLTIEVTRVMHLIRHIATLKEAE